MISPARVSLYSTLAESFDLLILHGGAERNRGSWQGTESFLADVTVERAWGWQIPLTRKESGKIYDEQYLHIHPGYFSRLISFSPDVVVSAEMGARTLLALVYGALFRRSVWIWWGGTIHTEQKKSGRIRRLLRSIFAHWGRHWISYGQSSTDYLLTLGIPREHILEIQNTADERYFEYPSSQQFNLQPKPVLLYVGQFIARKGIKHLLHAAAAIQLEGLDFSLLLVGSGRERQTTKLLAQDLGLRNIHFVPGQSPQSMPSVYRSANMLVFPTLEDPWGLVANEAMLAGLPVLCSKYAGCAYELFTPDCIFDPEDEGEFCEKLRRAVTGQLPGPDMSRLKSSREVAEQMIRALERSVRNVRLKIKKVPGASQQSDLSTSFKRGAR